ncbi:MAG: hypothetical protein ACI9VS_003836, partial [Candidatus Binatia bacterium]
RARALRKANPSLDPPRESRGNRPSLESAIAVS